MRRGFYYNLTNENQRKIAMDYSFRSHAAALAAAKRHAKEEGMTFIIISDYNDDTDTIYGLDGRSWIKESSKGTGLQGMRPIRF